MRSRPKRFRETLGWTRPGLIASGLAALALAGTACVRVKVIRQALSRPEVVIGTASPTDIDYPLGGATCRLFNLATPRHGVRCVEEPSAGPIANIESLRSGRIDIGIVPSDILADAVAGEGRFASSGPVPDLRVLFVGHADVFTLVAHQASGIRTVADLRGKRINIGSPGSRQRADMEHVMAALGLTRNDFADVRELPPAEQSRAFCANELDAIVYSAGQPNGLVRDATLTCHGVLVSVSGPAVDRMLSRYGEYERVVILGGTYSVNPADVRTFGVRAVVVTTKRMPDAVAYDIVKAVFDNFDDFRRLHPAFKALSLAEMVRTTEPVPVHAGAMRYYRERGWLR
jgi:TRAP transporter TAXI family solute receptor